MNEEDLDAIVSEVLEDETKPGSFAEPEAPKSSAKPKPKVLAFINQTALKEDLSFSPNTIDDAMMTQASLFAHYATQAAKAQLQADRLKSQVELIEALIDKEIRDEAADSGRKITEALVEKTIRLDSRYQDAVSNYNEAKMVATMTKSVTEAFTQRRDMLVQIGKDLREERSGSHDVQVRADLAKEKIAAGMQR